MTSSSQFFAKLRWKLCMPEYLLRPQQIARRIVRKLTRRQPVEIARLPWGVDLRITAPELILNAVWYRGVYDVVTSETIWRLLDSGETAIDVGAHVGYMTSIMAVRVGPAGRVVSFEPHPALFEELQTNVRAWRGVAGITLHQAAVSDRTGEGILALPHDWNSNRGVARLVAGPAAGDRGPVTKITRLDDVFAAGTTIGLAKLDVESHEQAVLAGASRLLRTGAIRDIVFEELGAYPTPAMRLLEDAGYEIFSLGKRFRRPRLCRPDRSDASPRDDPNYLATRAPERARERMQVNGWSVLHDRLPADASAGLS